MGSRGQKEYLFVCPECNESLKLDDPMRDALLVRGCVICGAAVTADAFTSESSADAS
ncbi:DUF7560 family zinc ribbon protein [Salinibaculum salinum]|uniref:DUF7560 family zinc ribbon protein n=1 Tax=Salinibaculum salinum TaxID=3131996 RepID=UPI0030EF09E1